MYPADLDLFPPGVRRIEVAGRPPLRGRVHDVAGLVGVAARGPLHLPQRVDSLPSFELLYGPPIPAGFLAHAAAGYFENGGRAAWIVRVADPLKARHAKLDVASPDGKVVRLVATSPGRWGDAVRLRFIPTSERHFTLLIHPPDAPLESWGGLTFDFDPDEDAEDRQITTVLGPSAGDPGDDPTAGAERGGARPDELRRFTSRERQRIERASRWVWALAKPGWPISPLRPLAEPGGAGATLAGGADGLETLAVEHFHGTGQLPDAAHPDALPRDGPYGLEALAEIDEVAVIAMPEIAWRAPGPAPAPPPLPPLRCEDLEVTAVVLPEPVTPPRSERRPPLSFDDRDRLRLAMVTQARTLRDRVAILDCEHPSDPRRILDPGSGPAVDSVDQSPTADFGALYFPWIERRIGDRPILVPPSGHVAGIYARTTLRAGVHVPPANEVLEGVTGLGYAVTDDEHARLNADHVNVLRHVPGRRLRVMGGRTRHRQGPMRFVNIRRLLNFLIETLDEETQWLVFEPNTAGQRLQLERAVRGFLDAMWRAGMLDGGRPEEAYAVVCDDTVNPPATVDQGRLVCEVGIRPPRPAEWVWVRFVRSEGGLELVGLGEG